ncbi:type I-E CRISPR-associated protein Cse1/CasA [Frankia tisae]|uniref:type I-E CRISPR-associated protein Cse1/CasA n=1 Tax=Frankia tisae TaxID=2950104 RepID=UPI0021C143B1|nr:type I-E CRISPR-associated protein Cse1/CasA [Frankia tisae]
MTTYNLLTEKWMPVTRAKDGAFDTVSLTDAVTEPEGIAALADSNPLAEIATLRLLLAIIQAALNGPTSDTDRLHRFQKRFPADEVAGYLEKHRHSFDLFHPTAPFFQDPTLLTALEERNQKATPSSRMRPNPAVDLGFPQMAAAQKILHSHAHHGADRDLDAGEAARLLLAHQAFARAGKVQIGGSAKISPLSGALVVAPEGRNLAETLLLSLHTSNVIGSPVWAGPASGWLGRLTWPSRRILLFPHDNGRRVTRVLIGTGRPPPDEEPNREPMFAYYPAKRTTRRKVLVQPERATWRDVAALYQSDQTSNIGADILTNAARLLPYLDPLHSHMAAVNVYGAPGGGQKDAPAMWIRDRFPLPAEFLEPESPAVAELTGRLSEADRVDAALQKQLTAAFQRGNKDLKLKRDYRPTVRPLAAYWWALEPAFRILLAQYAAHPSNRTHLDAVTHVWADAVRTAALDCFAKATQAIALSPRSAPALIRARADLERTLNKIFP